MASALGSIVRSPSSFVTSVTSKVFELRLVLAAALGNDRKLRAEESRSFVVRRGLPLTSFLITLASFASITTVLLYLTHHFHSPLTKGLFDTQVSLLGLVQVPNYILWSIFPFISVPIIGYLNFDESRSTIAAIIMTFVVSTGIQSKVFHALALIEGPLGPMALRLAFHRLLETVVLVYLIRSSLIRFYPHHGTNFFAVVMFSFLSLVQNMIRVWFELGGGSAAVSAYVRPMNLWQGLSIFVITVFFLQRMMMSQNELLKYYRTMLWTIFGAIMVPIALINLLDWVSRIFPFTGFKETPADDAENLHIVLQQSEQVPGEEIFVIIASGLGVAVLLLLRLAYLSTAARKSLPAIVYNPLPAGLSRIVSLTLLALWTSSFVQLVVLFH